MKLKLSLAVLALAAFAYGQDAASDVKKAAEDTGHATKTAAKKTGHATAKAADKTADATKDARSSSHATQGGPGGRPVDAAQS